MQADTLHAAAAYGAGLLLTLFLAAWLTPRRWWRRPTARGALILGGGAWLVGTMLLWAVPLAKPAPAPVMAAAPVSAAPFTGQDYLARQDLNLRAAAGVNAARIGLVHGGAAVIPTGGRDGDWWQVKARIDGRDRLGWASSLWLRRPGETPVPPR